MKRKIIILSFLMLLTSGTAFTLPAESVEPLLKNDYYSQICTLVQGAKESIYVLMYAIQIGKSDYEPVNKLCRDLIEAHKRGVKVEIILEHTYAQRDKLLNKSNQKAFDLFYKEGIKVRFDDPKKTLHSKVIIIDGNTTILGSHNWTYTAFQRNNESSILIKSSKVAQEFLRYFRTIGAK